MACSGSASARPACTAVHRRRGCIRPAGARRRRPARGRPAAHPQQALLGLRAGRLDADLLHALQQQLVLGLQVRDAALQRLDAQHLALARLARRLAVLRAPARPRDGAPSEGVQQACCVQRPADGRRRMRVWCMAMDRLSVQKVGRRRRSQAGTRWR